MIKNPQSSAILENIHQVVTNMMTIFSLDMQDTCTLKTIRKFISNVACAICSTHHTVLGSTPGTVIFGRNMLFNILYLAD